MERARKLLAYEGTLGGTDDCGVTRVASAARVYDKLRAHLAPLVGDAGVELLFVRSAKLTKGEFAWIAKVSILEGSAALREYLERDDPAVATESAAALFGNFFALITTFIGARLTTQVLQKAWPTLDEMPAGETRK